ncbi:Crp/Fnr family transcriptional regulator [uncultured Enterovirga sp.]|uniref:Crp/Fnr family transcriptional regulator n=1 Tax=uncultured Enterovirga sp. TaxID=2026352 RepID=UPI0035CA1CE1
MLLRKLDSIAVLGDADRKAIAGLPVRMTDLKHDQDFIRDGDVGQECCLLVDGFMHRYKVLPDGKRQILAFHTPGDIPDLQSLLLPNMDHGLAALVPCTVAFISHQGMRGFLAAHPRVTEALWRDTLIDAAIFREWLTSMGQRTARGHLAHLVCEFFTRCRAVGVGSVDSCPFPMTQLEIADALGLSDVHVNRTITELRNDGLISIQKRTLTILDWPALVAEGQFDPAYLHIRESSGLVSGL